MRGQIESVLRNCGAFKLYILGPVEDERGFAQVQIAGMVRSSICRSN